ncbi:uncharacterized protein LOC143476272 [Brachyhypopomus gauderio]|uniref:uncharacterized protein LOC143476272 n=1 Tax=Brachyhypopomus gauderio TaxID=698409 RepID=UPI0040435896
MPTMTCQNTWRQIESIHTSLKTLRSAFGGMTNPEDTKLSLPANKMSKCGLEQRLTNLQACELNLSSQIQKIFNHMKTETQGLVDNMQMNSKTDNCVLSPPVCPTSDLSLWNQITVLLESWSKDVVVYSDKLLHLCPLRP